MYDDAFYGALLTTPKNTIYDNGITCRTQKCTTNACLCKPPIQTLPNIDNALCVLSCDEAFQAMPNDMMEF